MNADGVAGPEFDDGATAYVRGGTVSTFYAGRWYAFSDVNCATVLTVPAIDAGAVCGHPLLSHEPQGRGHAGRGGPARRAPVALS